MGVGDAIYYAGIVVAGLLIITLAAFVLAGVLEEGGSSLVDLAQTFAIATVAIFISTTATLMTLVVIRFHRQPDITSSDGARQQAVHQNRRDGAGTGDRLKMAALSSDKAAVKTPKPYG